MAFCKNILSQEDQIDVSTSSKCRYHPPLHFKLNRLAPSGLCPEAFHSLHPICFQTMLTPSSKYSKRVISYYCPGGSIRFRVYRTWNILPRYIFINILHGFLGLFKTTETFLHRIFMEIEEIRGNCPYEYRVGQSFEYNIGHHKALCPAGYYNIFPFIAGRLYGIKNELEINEFECPDHLARVRYRFQGYPIVKDTRPLCCSGSPGVYIEVNKNTGTKNIIDINLLEKSVHIPCLSLLHSLYPYYLTLVYKGRLGFFTNNYNSALVSCPSNDAKVVAKIERSPKDGTITAKLDSIKGTCPKGLHSGTVYNLTQINNLSPLEILSNTYTYVVNANGLQSKKIRYLENNEIICDLKN